MTDIGGACYCYADDAESPTLYRETIRKARKIHLCCECRQGIAIGEHYQHVVGIWEGEFSEYRSHLACARIRRDFGCGVFGYLRNEFFADWGFSPFEVPE